MFLSSASRSQILFRHECICTISELDGIKNSPSGMLEMPRLLLTLYGRDTNNRTPLLGDIPSIVLGSNHYLVTIVKFHILLQTSLIYRKPWSGGWHTLPPYDYLLRLPHPCVLGKGGNSAEAITPSAHLSISIGPAVVR